MNSSHYRSRPGAELHEIPHEAFHSQGECCLGPYRDYNSGLEHGDGVRQAGNLHSILAHWRLLVDHKLMWPPPLPAGVAELGGLGEGFCLLRSLGFSSWAVEVRLVMGQQPVISLLSRGARVALAIFAIVTGSPAP